MRLTLRTLLAYLDDTLDPGEIKQIGQKVAESDAAQELIARIKQITRQRRLTTPPLTGPGAKFDANSVAEYLDNDLPSEQVSELEKTCLESDVHLAEIAACHQILTLVLGEPALVPPTAKERMYQLVHGREAIPYRKAPTPITTSPTDSTPDLEPDESPLLGLPFFRQPGHVRWLLPVGAVLLLVGLGIAIWMALPSDSKTNNDKVASLSDKDKEKAEKEKAEKEKVEKEKAEKEKAEREKADKEKADREKAEKDKAEREKAEREKNGKTDPMVKVDTPSRLGKRIPPPKTDRVNLGTYALPERLPTVLVSRPRQGDVPFKRLQPGAAIYSSETLINLPGYTSDIESQSGVRLTLRGNLPDFSIDPLMDSLLEVAVILHAPEKETGIDLDLTLQRGRIYLSNLKEKKDAIVRLRFLEQVWDITLAEGAEVGMDLIKKYTPDINYFKDDPRTDVALCALHGKVQILVNSYHMRKLEAPPGLALLQWDSVNEEPPNALGVRESPLIWSHVSPSIVLSKHLQGMKDAFIKAKVDDAARIKPFILYYEGQLERTKKDLLALDELSGRLNTKPLESELEEQRLGMSEVHRQIAIFALGALGELDKLLATLTDEDPEHFVERDNAIFALRRYISHGAEAGRNLFYDDGKQKTGLLVEKYGEKDGEKVFTLLHDFKPEILTPATFDLLTRLLKNDKLAVRQLAIWQLSRLSVQFNVPVPKDAAVYNPTAPREFRDKAAIEWQKLVEDGKLPPVRQQ